MICFCSHQPVDLVGANCLSQWYPSEFKSDGIIFSTAEQYMMYNKAILFRDEVASIQILREHDPKEIKKIGRLILNFKEDEWSYNARRIVTDGNLYKFSQNPHLKEYLLSTGNQILAESAHYDKVWGTGLNEENTRKTPQDKWPGTNWLGQCLMSVRETLKNLKE